MDLAPRTSPTVSARSCTTTPGGDFPQYRSLHQEISADLTIDATESANVRTDRLSQVGGRHRALRQAALSSAVIHESISAHNSATTRTAACGRARGSDPESSATCRRANSAAAQTGRQRHASTRACAPRVLGMAWRRGVSRPPSGRRRIRTRRPNRHHPHTTKASTGRQRTDRSSMTRADHNAVAGIETRAAGGPRFACDDGFSSGATVRGGRSRLVPRRRRCRLRRGLPPSTAVPRTRLGSRRRRSGSLDTPVRRRTHRRRRARADR